MRIQRNFLYLAIACTLLSACSSQMSTSTDNMQVASDNKGGLTEAKTDAPVTTGSSMDEIDRSKLSHVLDAGLGKSTTWQNASTGMKYTVTPTEKLSVGGNPFCRRYNVVTEKNGNQQSITGTACVATDGAWHPV